MDALELDSQIIQEGHDGTRFAEVCHIDNLIEEVLVEILCRLSLKRVHQCKCVSKHWQSLISSPDFINWYVNYEPHNSLSHFSLISQSKRPKKDGWLHHIKYYKEHRRDILAISGEKVFKSRGFSFKFLPVQPVCLLGFCNGLVLCSNGDKNMYFVCNPQTMQWVQLPRLCPWYKAESDETLVGFMSDYYYDKEGAQFGSNTWCKVVFINKHELDYSNLINVNIFSSETGQWFKKVVSCQRFFTFDFNRCSSSSTICNGIQHWLDPRYGFISYDLCNNADCFGFIHLPNEKHFDMECDPSFGVCQGCLMVSVYEEVDILRVWTLRDYYKGEWQLEYRIDNLSDLVDLPAQVFEQGFEFEVTFSPVDDNEWYLSIFNTKYKTDSAISSYKIKNENLELFWQSRWGSGDRLDRVFPFVLLCWPTPIPKFNPYRNLLLDELPDLGEIIQSSSGPYHLSIIPLKNFRLFKIA